MMKECVHKSSENSADYILDPQQGITDSGVQEILWHLKDGLDINVSVLGRLPWWQVFKKSMEKNWESNRDRNLQEGDILEYGGRHMYRTIDGWFFIDETESDSYGPYETQKECSQGMKNYASQL